MSIFPFQFMNDLMASPSSEQDGGGRNTANGSTASSSTTDEESVYSDSVMMSGISTDPTTALTVPGDAASVQTTDSPIAPVYGDHGAVTGLPPGTFIEIYREHMARTVVVHPSSQHTNNGRISNSSSTDDNDDHTQGSEFGGTIISSAPSGTNIEAPPLHESWHMTSYPRPIHRDNLSISTTESMYRDLVSLHHEHDDDQSIPENGEGHTQASSSLGAVTDVSSLSLQPSMMESAITVTTSSDAPESTTSPADGEHHPPVRSTTTTSHERDIFVHVADRLARQAQPPPSDDMNHPSNNSCEWYVRFTEQDWLAFQRDATMILAALKDSHGSAPDENVYTVYDRDRDLSAMPPPLPPPPLPEHVQLPVILPNGLSNGLPNGPTTDTDTDTVMPLSYCAADALPDSFICVICDDVIVGSMTLDCGCAQSTVCTVCWERRHCSRVSSQGYGDDDDELEDLVHVVAIHDDDDDNDNKTCPFCQKAVVRAMPCHALDVAILHCVNALPDNEPQQQTQLPTQQYHPVKMAYYHRLEAWRLEVERRRQEYECPQLVVGHRRNNQQYHDRLLAELIQEEEKYFWNKEQQQHQQQQPRSFWQTNKHLLIVVAELALVASAAAFHGGSGGVMRGTLRMPR